MAERNKFPFEMYVKGAEGKIVAPRYNENSMEIVEVTEGRVVIQIGTELIDASAGDFVCVPPKMVFRVDSVEGYAGVRGMIFNTSVVENNMHIHESEIFYMFYVQAVNRITVFNSEHPIYATLSRCMSAAYDEYMAKDVCYMLPIRANIYLIVTELLRYYCGSKNEEDRAIYHNVLRLRSVITYINEHFSEKIYIEKLADMITVSPDYFTKMFKESIGKTPIDYINGLRVNRAMYLLFTTESQMSELAEQVGFCNPNYLHKIFKQYMGVSPLNYRKSSQS